MTDSLVLIDTSVWIEYFRARNHPASPLLAALREQNRACICGLVVAELLQGSQSKKDAELANSLTATSRVLPDTLATWQRAGDLAATLRRKGLTIGLIDCYLAALALEHRADILSLDSHFQDIAKHFPLSVLKPAVA